MLSDKLRDGANSKGFKIILGLIMVSFVLTGVGGYLIPRLDTDPVSIGDYKISSNEWTNQYNRQAQQLHRMQGGAQLLENPQYVATLKKQVLERMIDNVAFNSTVWDLGIRIGDEQVRDVIRRTPAFQKDGRFDNELYLATIRNMGMSPDYYGEQLRVSLMSESVARPLLNTATMPLPFELDNVAKVISQTREVDLYTVDPADLAKNITVSDEEAKAYYDNNPNEFKAPANVKFNYLLLSMDDLRSQVEVTDAKLEDFFNMYSEDFKIPEQRQVAHIIIRANSKDTAKRVEAVEKALARGESFAKVAKEYSDDNATKDKGGDMGLFSQGQLAANLDAVVFSMTKEGQVSDPIVDDFGTHFVALTKIEAAHTPELADVKDKVKTAYVNAQARDLYNERVTTMSDLSFENPDSLDVTAEALKIKDVKDKVKTAYVNAQARDLYNERVTTMSDLSFENPDSLDVTAEALKIKVQDSKKVNQGDSAAKWPFNTEAVQSLAFNEEVYSSGVNSQVVSIDDNNSIVINVYEHHDAALRSFEDVKELATKIVNKNKLNAAIGEALEQVAVKVTQDENASLAKNISVKKNVILSPSVNSVSAQMSQAIYALPSDTKGAYVINDNNGVETLAVLKKVTETSAEDLKTYAQVMNVPYAQYLNVVVQNGLNRQARALSDIVYNQEAIDLVTQNNNEE